MTLAQELYLVADRLDAMSERGKADKFLKPLRDLEAAAQAIGKAWSGSWIGYHATVYYAGLEIPPAGAQFSREWGIEEKYVSDGTTGDWRHFTSDQVEHAIYQKAGNPNLSAAKALSQEAATDFENDKAEFLSVLTTAVVHSPDDFLTKIKTDGEALALASQGELLTNMSKQTYWSRDSLAMSQGLRTPPHIKVLTEVYALRIPVDMCAALGKLARRAATHLSRKQNRGRMAPASGNRIFIGHGGSPVWKELRDFIRDRLELPWEEFNRVSPAGLATSKRLMQMMENAAMAFVVLTAEDELADGKLRARQNAVHEAGLFQGKLGFERAIILLEEGCEEFSNIHGLGQIRFPKGRIGAAFEEIRQVLERENIVGSS